MAFAENLTVFFKNSQFSETVTTAAGRKFEAIFDEAYYDPESGEAVLDSLRPRLTCSFSDLAGIHRTNILTIGSVAYSVMNIQPDGTGTATVELSLQS
jgi:hypothetical protein